jgi:hypothetical protein
MAVTKRSPVEIAVACPPAAAFGMLHFVKKITKSSLRLDSESLSRHGLDKVRRLLVVSKRRFGDRRRFVNDLH